MSRHFVTTEETTFAIPNADGTLIYGTCPAGCNISTGQPVCETSIDAGGTYYDLILAEAVPWVAGMDVSTVPVSYNGELYQPLQAHKTQSDWTPGAVPALFRIIPKPVAGYETWAQRYAAPYYRVGDMVIHKGWVWRCTAADANGNNVWEPGVYGWTKVEAV